MLRSLFLLTLLASGCYHDDHPEYQSTIVASTSSGPVFVILDYAFKESSDGEVLLSEDGIRRIDVATGEDSGRLGLNAANTHCAPAHVDHIWCNSGGEHSIRRLDTMRPIADNDDLAAAGGGRFPTGVAFLGMEITPIAHELVMWNDADEFAIDPVDLSYRTIDRLTEPTISNVELAFWGSADGLVLGGYRYYLTDYQEGNLSRRPAGDPTATAEVLDPSHIYEYGRVLVADVVDAAGEAMRASDPESLFMIENQSSTRYEGLPIVPVRLSRLRTDGSLVWTHEDSDGSVHAAAISGSTIAFVIRPVRAAEEEFAATIVGLSLTSGEELYRIDL